MKIRILGQSIRIRLQKNDLGILLSDGQIRNSLQVGPLPRQSWNYSVETDVLTDQVSIGFEEDRLCVRIHPDILTEMIETDRIGVEKLIKAEGIMDLSILVEKDFKCLSPRNGDEDAFPHPESAHLC